MATPLIAEIKLFGGSFAPRAWAFCEGQLLSVSSNTALFSLLGTTYGGDGRSTFALPDLRGRIAVHAGRGPGLSTITLGMKGGVETVVLNETQMPNHSHFAMESSASSQNHVTLDTSAAINEFPAAGDVRAAANFTDGIATKNVRSFGPPSAPNAVAGQKLNGSAGMTLGNTGNGQAHENRQPFLCVYHIIAMFGVYPSRG